MKENTSAHQALTLEQSFEHLRANARSVPEVVDWFKARPEMLVGDALKLVDGEMKVSHHFDIADAVKTAYFMQKIVFDITLEMNTELVLHDIITKLCPDTFPLKTVGFKEKYTFELPLNEWPFATALVTGLYLRFPRFYAHEPWALELEQTLTENLEHHFKQYSLARIRDLHTADLLPLKDDALDIKALVMLLFESRNAGDAITLPCDMMAP